MKKRIFKQGYWKTVGIFIPSLYFLVCTVINLDLIDYTYASSISLSAPSNISIELEPSAEGTFATSDTSAQNISITTDNYAGYTLGVAASTENASNDLKNLGDNDELIDSISSISSPVSAEDFANNNANAYNNTWGLRPSKYDSEDNTTNNYYPAPTSTTMTVLDETSSANTTPNTYNLAVGVRATSAKAPGKYSGTIVITAIANASAYSISYNDPSGEASNLPANISTTTYGDTVTISDTIPTRTGYIFAGWCTESVADNASCTGTTYATGDDWTLDRTTSSNSLTLYAMWRASTLTVNLGTGIYGAQIKSETLDGESVKLVTASGDTVTIDPAKNYYLIPLYESGYTLNNITPEGGTVTQDNANSYGYYYYTPNASVNNVVTITGKKLPTETTATSGSSFIAMQSINSSNSSTYCPAIPTAVKDNRDNSVYYVQTLADGNCWMLENLRLGGDSTIILTSADSNVNTNFTLPASGNVNFTDDTASYETAAINMDYNETTVVGYGAGRNYIGAYYNYCAVSAGTICTDSNEDDDTFNICPANWTIPSGDATGQYSNLATALNSTITEDSFSGELSTIYRYHLSLSLAGVFRSGQTQGYNQGILGVFWSTIQSSAKDANMHTIRVDSDTVNPRTSHHPRYYGFPVRCILQ